MNNWYRYVDVTYAAPVDEWDNICGPSRTVTVLREYPVIKLTPQGAQLRVDLSTRWAKRDCIRHFACPTKAEAGESYLARKKKQLGIFLARADDVRYLIKCFKERLPL